MSRSQIELYSPRDLSEKLGVAKATLSAWRREQRGPTFVRLTKRCIRYRSSDVEAFLASGGIDAQRKSATSGDDS